jgi:hypothetical protein
VATQTVTEEIARHLPCLATKRGLDQALLFAALQVIPIEWKAAANYEDQRAQAEQRIAARDPDDCAHGRRRAQARPLRLVTGQGPHGRRPSGLHDRRPARRTTSAKSGGPIHQPVRLGMQAEQKKPSPR